MVQHDPTDLDLLVRDLVAAALTARAPESADLSFEWSDQAQMWFTELQPHEPSAAALSLAFDGDDLLSCMVGATWFEVFPISTADEDLGYVRSIVDAVIAGRVEESGLPGKEFARIELESQTISVGAAYLPWPWRGRASRKYRPYS